MLKKQRKSLALQSIKIMSREIFQRKFHRSKRTLGAASIT